jgi:hypothetical protein
MRCRLVCKQEFQTIQVPDNDCMVQKTPGKLVTLEVEGRSSSVKRRAILKLIGTSLTYWHDLPRGLTNPPAWEGQLNSPHLALAAKAFYENFSQPPNTYGESIIVRALCQMPGAPAEPPRYTFPLESIIFPCAIVRKFVFFHRMISQLSFR